MEKRNIIKSLLLTTALTLNISAYALKFPLPDAGNEIVGQLQTTVAHRGDTLSSIGMRYDIGYYEMVEANPDLPKSSPIRAGLEVLIPSRFVLPNIQKGMVVNLAELRVYYFPVNEKIVYTFPIGAGREGWNTPRAVTRVADKKKDPVWVVPDSILAESRAQGKPIKKYWPAGPKNPLGKYAIYLGIPGIRIHGTNVQPTVGRRISHGCIRMYADDIEFLYHNVPIGTPVVITHEENKVGWDDHVLYLEAEVPFKEYHDSLSAKEEIARSTQNHPAVIDWQRVAEVLDTQNGMPEAIGHDNTIASIPQQDEDTSLGNDTSSNVINQDGQDQAALG